jgi:hypothetical protein
MNSNCNGREREALVEMMTNDEAGSSKFERFALPLPACAHKTISAQQHSIDHSLGLTQITSIRRLQ